MKMSSILLTGCAILACTGFNGIDQQDYRYLASIEAETTTAKGSSSSSAQDQSVNAGHYLSARFAQQHHDWEKAGGFLEHLLTQGVEDLPVLRRAMILAMGTGDADRAVKIAKKVKALDPSEDNSVAQIFLIMDAFEQNNMNEASKLIDELPDDNMAKFIKPLLEGWADAGQGKLDIKKLDDNSMQLYHAALIANFLDQPDQVKQLLVKLENSEGIGTSEIEQIGDLYANVGMPEKAKELYEVVLSEWPGDAEVLEKVKLLEDGQGKDIYKPVKEPREGLAFAFYNIAKILYQEYSDESARVFSAMSLHLNPDLTVSKILSAYISARHGHYDQAIEYYKSVPENDKYYVDAQRSIADSYEEMEEHEKSLQILAHLVSSKQDIDSQIKIGDIFRRQEQFGQAIEAYTKAETLLNGNIPQSYWHLHYLRGMAYERAENWDKAEADLQAALEFQPNHPYILNYLGYAWADRNMNLNKSLQMIRTAVNLRPSDGYITDSLGWVLYRMGQFRQSVPELERAVELLPYDPVINDHLGDAYWQVGRSLEAKFQWERAKNHSEDESFIKTVEQKLEHGLMDDPEILGKNSQKSEEDRKVK